MNNKIDWTSYLRGAGAGLASLGLIVSQVEGLGAMFPKLGAYAAIVGAVVAGLSDAVKHVLMAVDKNSVKLP
jgi:hypothetical protein